MPQPSPGAAGGGGAGERKSPEVMCLCWSRAHCWVLVFNDPKPQFLRLHNMESNTYLLGLWEFKMSHFGAKVYHGVWHEPLPSADSRQCSPPLLFSSFSLHSCLAHYLTPNRYFLFFLFLTPRVLVFLSSFRPKVSLFPARLVPGDTR